MTMRLPDFIVIGAQKAGTTALSRALALHPQIFLPAFPEPAFFSFEGGAPSFSGPQSPNSSFGLIPDIGAYASLYAGVDARLAAGDVSSHYSYCSPDSCAAGIRRYIPEAKIIAILRQPADRAYSAFSMMRQKGLEPLKDFAIALAAGDSPARANWTPDFHYRRNGMYCANLSPYYRNFPESQIRVFLYEEWARNPARVLSEIFLFLGVDENLAIDTSGRHRESLRPRNEGLIRILRRARSLIQPLFPAEISSLRNTLRPYLWTPPRPLSASLRRSLTASYREEIHRLEDLIHRDLSLWMTETKRDGR